MTRLATETDHWIDSTGGAVVVSQIVEIQDPKTGGMVRGRVVIEIDREWLARLIAAKWLARKPNAPLGPIKLLDGAATGVACLMKSAKGPQP